MSAPGQHLTAAEIARLRLPGLPATSRGILFLAAREAWPSIARTARGGGRVFPIDCLPDAARQALGARNSRPRSAPKPANLRQRGRPKGSDFFTLHPAAAAAVEAILSERAIAAPRILELLAQSFDPLPHHRTLQRFIRRIERDKAALLASTRDPDLYRGRFRLALGRADAHLTRANQRWEIDTTKADVLTRGGRRAILGLIDVWSRRARFLVVPSESAQSVRRLLVTTIEDWGVMPDEIGTDNGSGFVNASLKSALPALGIRMAVAPPGSPEKKPYVERLFGTFTRERAELLAGYCGHNVAEAQALRARARDATGRAVVVPELRADELQTILDNWTEGVYGQRPHSATRQAPLARWASSPSPSTRAPSSDALKIALSRCEGSARVGKRGLRWKGGRYWAPALAAFVGRDVSVRRDEDDLGALFVFDGDGHYIDTAVNHERAGLSEEAFALAARRSQAEWLAEQRAELRAKRKAFSIEAARDALLRDDAERAGRVVPFPPATIARPTRQLASIAARPSPCLPSPASLAAALESTAPKPRKVQPPIADRVAAADALIAAAARASETGEPVDEAALASARLFTTSTAYLAHKLMTCPPAVRRNIA